MPLPEGYTLVEQDIHDRTHEDIAESVAFSNVLKAELLPDDPPARVEDAIKSFESMPARYRGWRFQLRDGKDQLVGLASWSVDPDHDENPDILWTGLAVHPEERRQGLGSALLARLVTLAEAEGRTRIIAHSNDLKPDGRSFAEAVGADAKQAMHVNHLPIDAVDRALMERWVAEGPGRAPGYELISWDGRCPDEHVDAFVDLVLVMNTAPRDGLEVNDFTMTVDEFREMEDRGLQVGQEMWTVVARRRSDGAFAGFHDVSWHESDPNTVWVGATGVKPEHRGHALGKWLKAVITLRVLDERPQVTSIRTGNADSNDAMLGINKLMGYRPLLAQTTWEISTEAASAWLAAKR